VQLQRRSRAASLPFWLPASLGGMVPCMSDAKKVMCSVEDYLNKGLS
jgi:hypothetical protein